MSSAKKPEPEDDNEKASAEGAEGSSEDSGEEKKKFSAKKILIIAVPLILLIGGGAGAYFTGMLDSLLGKAPAAEGEAGHGESHDKNDKKAAKGGHGEHGEPGAFFVKIPDMIVNLNNTEGQQQRYLRLSIQLEVADEADGKALEALMPRVIDQFQTYLRELRARDLRGSAGLYRLQIELLNRVNEAAAPIEVKDVLFQEILIQ